MRNFLRFSFFLIFNFILSDCHQRHFKISHPPAPIPELELKTFQNTYTFLAGHLGKSVITVADYIARVKEIKRALKEDE